MNLTLRNSLLYALFAFSLPAIAQLQFTNENSRLTGFPFRSGGPITVVDWNGDGLDDLVRLKNGREVVIDIQRPNQTFESRNFGQFSSNNGWAWAMCVADVDQNGYLDIVAGSSSQLRIMMMNDDGTAGSITNIPGGNFFVQNLTFGDINNDGWIDLFACDDVNRSKVFLNDGEGTLVISNIIDFDVTDSDDSGNYGSVWTDFDNDGDLDLYIAKCRQGVTSPTDGRRINVMFVNNGDNTFTENAAEYGIDIGWQTWTASFGDIDNDGDLDLLITNHDFQSQIFENDGAGYYTDITSQTNFTLNITPIQSVMEDFDNDGWIDIFVTGNGGGRLFKNNGNKTFSLVTGLFSPSNILTFAIGDLNHDGKVDIYTGHGTGYVTPSSTTDDNLWTNSTQNNNHFLVLNLEGTESEKGAIGSRAYIYGAWGVQLREVRAGESYGTVNSTMLHFGLGQETVVDSIVIHWTSGNTQTIVNPEIDQFIKVIENECVSPFVSITATGPAVICGPETVTLTATAGLTYVWNDGSTGQSIEVGAQGTYLVRAFEAGNDCEAISAAVFVQEAPDETPIISAVGETVFCTGESVVIQAPEGLNNYVWSNGETGSSITVSESGTYSLTIQGACSQFTSASVVVTVITPAIPDAEDISIATPSSVVLNATGDNIYWFDGPDFENILATGSTFETPTITETTTFYVASAMLFGEELASAGLAAPSGNSAYSGDNNTNALTYFDVFYPCVLKQVNVVTDIPGIRIIELKDADGNILDSREILITGSMTIELNFELPIGNGYTLGTNTEANLAIEGWALPSPRLRRNSSGVNYPYLGGSMLRINTSSFGNQYFYYFYNWQVERIPEVCYSNPRPVTVTLEEPTSLIQTANQVRIYPNPASQFLRIETGGASAIVEVLDQTGRLIRSESILGDQTLSTNGIANGLYLVRIHSKGASQVLPIVISN